MEALAQEGPKCIPAKLFQFGAKRIRFGRGHNELNDGDGAARVLPLVVIKLPAAFHRAQITWIARSAIEVHISFQVGAQIAVGTIVRIMTDGAVLTRGQLRSEEHTSE